MHRCCSVKRVGREPCASNVIRGWCITKISKNCSAIIVGIRKNHELFAESVAQSIASFPVDRGWSELQKKWPSYFRKPAFL